MKNLKSWKTTLIGIICLVNVFVCLFLVYLKIIQISDVTMYLPISTPIILSVATFFSKDSNVTGGTIKQ